MIQEGICNLNKRSPSDNPYIIYWMQNAQRTEYNHALEFAIRLSNENKKPLIVYFGLTNNYPQANLRHYQFMIEGLDEVRIALKKRNIRLLLKNISPEKGALELSAYASAIIVDKGYTISEKKWRTYLAENAKCLVISVETNLVVPVEAASQKEQYSAATFRPKISKLLDYFNRPLEEEMLLIPSLDLPLVFDDNIIDTNDFLLTTDPSVGPSPYFKGGTSEAKKRLDDFLDEKIICYDEYGNDPGLRYTSNLSPYLHFGQISPLYILQRLPEKAEGYIEELIIRRELSFNFIYYNDHYDSYESIPSWARTSLEKHKPDKRGYIYTAEELEAAFTHDIYWNNAQKEMVITGKIHGYMRMYWGKKIIEWSPDSETAYRIALYLNNKYCLDGRDANSYTGIAWCFGKHDRPWKERDIFGTVRYMNDKGLERKFNMGKYIRYVDSL